MALNRLHDETPRSLLLEVQADVKCSGRAFSLMTQCMVRPCVARGFRREGDSGLASMYPAFDWSIAPGHHGYQHACDLISGKALRAILVTSIRMRREDRTSISSHSLADLGG